MSYDMPRHEFEPPQCGWISTAPLSAWHWEVNESSVRLGTIVDEVTTAASGIPESHVGAAEASRPIGVSGPESEVELGALFVHVDTEAHKRPPSAADRSARLAEDSIALS